MKCCEKAKQLLKMLKKLKRMLFTNYEDDEKMAELLLKKNRLISKINVEYEKFRAGCEGVKDFNSPEILGTVEVSKVNDMISELKRYIRENCEDAK